MPYKEFPAKPTNAQMRERMAFMTEQVGTMERHTSYLVGQVEQRDELLATVAEHVRILEARVQSLEAEKQSDSQLMFRNIEFMLSMMTRLRLGAERYAGPEALKTLKHCEELLKRPLDP